MTTNIPDKKAVEEFLDENEDFLGTFLARRDSSKYVSSEDMVAGHPPTLTMSKCVEKVINHQRRQKKNIFDKTLTENQRFSEFVKDIASEINVDALSYKILQNVIDLTESDHGKLYLVEEIDENIIVSKLIDVTATSCLGNAMHNRPVAIRIPFGKGIVGTVAETRTAINIEDAQNDPRFDPDIDGLPEYKIRCILCVPIMNKESDVVGVAEIMNKRNGDSFSEKDEIIFTEYLSFCGIGINNARLFQMAIKEINRNNILLQLAWHISVGQSNFDQLVNDILQTAMKIIKCTFTKIYLLDKKGELFSKVYHLDKGSTTARVTKDEPADVYSVLAKELLDRNQNIELIDLDSEPGFVAANKVSPETEVDKVKVYEEDANWTLFAPIRKPSDESIGCIMFAGKTKLIRNESDVISVKAIAIYCGLGIYNSQLYDTTVRSLATKEIIMEIISYHLTTETEEVQYFVNLGMPSVHECDIYNVEFNDVMMNDESTVQVVALMFIKLNALSILRISIDNLYHWILTVKKNYKPLLYHNWRHVFNVTQIMFCALSHGSLKNFFSHFECICLLVATLCHDLDYQGLGSAKNLKPTSLLATIYSTSSSDNQILGRCITILNADETNIFRNVSAEKYREAMELIKFAILSTDINAYLLNVDNFEELKKKTTPFHNGQDKEMLIVLTMVSCDLIAFSKPWNHQKMIVLTDVLDLLEPQESGAAWLSKYEIDYIPKMMVHFIDVICLNVFETMAHFDDIFTRLYEACLKNRQIWEYMAGHFKEFNVESEVMKSRAGLIDFDDDFSSSFDGKFT